MIAAARDVVGAQVGDACEAGAGDDRLQARARVGGRRLGHLEEDAAQRVVDLLVVLVLALSGEPRGERARTDLLQEVRIAERQAEGHDERHGARVVLDHDPARREGGSSALLHVPSGADGSISPWTIECARKPTVANSLDSVGSTVGL